MLIIIPVIVGFRFLGIAAHHGAARCRRAAAAAVTTGAGLLHLPNLGVVALGGFSLLGAAPEQFRVVHDLKLIVKLDARIKTKKKKRTSLISADLHSWTARLPC